MILYFQTIFFIRMILLYLFKIFNAMKNLVLLLLILPFTLFGQKRTVTDLGVETINYSGKRQMVYVYDGNPFNDNEKSLKIFLEPLDFARQGKIIIRKSDVKSEKVLISLRARRANNYNGPQTVFGYFSYEFIFDNDRSTYFKLDPDSAKEIKSLDHELFLKFKKHKKVIVRKTSFIDKSMRTDAEYAINLNGFTAGINKYLENEAPTIKNKSLYKVVNGLANVNPFNLDKYIDKFILDAKKNHNINLSYVNKRERLILFRELEGETIAAAYKKDDDDKLLILVDPENWYAANQVKRWYIIYHELGHDILNLDHGEGGAMMNERASGKYTWSRLEKDKTIMFESYKN